MNIHSLKKAFYSQFIAACSSYIPACSQFIHTCRAYFTTYSAYTETCSAYFTTHNAFMSAYTASMTSCSAFIDTCRAYLAAYTQYIDACSAHISKHNRKINPLIKPLNNIHSSAFSLNSLITFLEVSTTPFSLRRRAKLKFLTTVRIWDEAQIKNYDK